MTVWDWAQRHGVPHDAYVELVAILDPTVTPISPGPAETSEAAVQANIQIEAGRRGVHLWRNNCGALSDGKGRLVRFGLGNTSARANEAFKSSDLIGVLPGGKFIAVECKEPGWKGVRSPHEIAQEKFLKAVRAAGGVGIFAQSVKDVFP